MEAGSETSPAYYLTKNKHQHPSLHNCKMKSIQMIYAVLVIAVLCNTGHSWDAELKCYADGGYCDSYPCREGYTCNKKFLYGCSQNENCCLPAPVQKKQQYHQKPVIPAYSPWNLKGYRSY
ncbi:uncharacterized protein LOC127703783 [Mytilus californianus]|uniref:uncharacterized protein LOC127703783 n=1 Tax=Mytilus californianus TaxID=6549 RepID=UPI0022464A7C|nr:uncharacterized protein LOC127703783 [Mytilus californianus]